MAEHPDSALLRRYADQRDERAFAELVQRRINLVYSVALRQCGGDAQLAEDVTQKVFADLARKAGALAGHAVLSGWLYRSAQFAASDLVRSERRRRLREEITMQTLSPETAAEWERLRPLLDEAMAELDDPDRDAIALRFFESRAFADIGATLQVTDDAARKRVDRALDKLRAVLARHGIDSTATALAVVLANQATMAAPAGLAASVSTAAIASSTAVAATVHVTAAGAGSPGGLSLAKALLAAGVVVAVAGFSFAVKRANEAQTARAELAVVAKEQRVLEADVRALEQTATRVQQHAEAADADLAQLLKAIGEAAPKVGALPDNTTGLAFVIDTSGSMRNPATGGLWSVVNRVVSEEIATHPGAQYLIGYDADGALLFGGRGWLPRTGQTLTTIDQVLKGTGRDTISNPVAGIYRVLSTLSAPGAPAHVDICVIGDEFIDREAAVLARLELLNPPDATGHRRATISAAQLPTTMRQPGGAMANTGLKFQALMAEVAKAHGGTYRLLPAEELK